MNWIDLAVRFQFLSGRGCSGISYVGAPSWFVVDAFHFPAWRAFWKLAFFSYQLERICFSSNIAQMVHKRTQCVGPWHYLTSTARLTLCFSPQFLFWQMHRVQWTWWPPLGVSASGFVCIWLSLVLSCKFRVLKVFFRSRCLCAVNVFDYVR